MNLAQALDAREVCVSKAAEIHLAVREHQPIPAHVSRALVVYTRCGIVGFEADYREGERRCPACFPEPT